MTDSLLTLYATLTVFILLLFVVCVPTITPLLTATTIVFGPGERWRNMNLNEWKWEALSSFSKFASKYRLYALFDITWNSLFDSLLMFAFRKRSHCIVRWRWYLLILYVFFDEFVEQKWEDFCRPSPSSRQNIYCILLDIKSEILFLIVCWCSLLENVLEYCMLHQYVFFDNDDDCWRKVKQYIYLMNENEKTWAGKE